MSEWEDAKKFVADHEMCSWSRLIPALAAEFASIRAESHAQAIRQAADRIRRFRGWMAEDFEEQLIAAVLALAPAARSETPTKEPR